MKISGYNSIQSSSNAARRRGASAASFADFLASSETSEASSIGSLNETSGTSLTNLLALQEIADEELHRKKLVQHGNSMLNTLEKLRTRLLMGTLPPHLLTDLERQLAQQKHLVHDPYINAVIDEIETRVAVELAKLQVAMSEQP